VPATVRGVKYMLLAEDMERAIAFWGEVFGATRTFGDEHWSETDLAGTTIAFHGGHDGGDNASGVSVEVADIEAAAATVDAHGGRVLDGPSRTPGEPVILATCADTEGNRFMLSQEAG
jgi:predicted enzyme related to lactoylglutathione lyase